MIRLPSFRYYIIYFFIFLYLNHFMFRYIMKNCIIYLYINLNLNHLLVFKNKNKTLRNLDTHIYRTCRFRKRGEVRIRIISSILSNQKQLDLFLDVICFNAIWDFMEFIHYLISIMFLIPKFAFFISSKIVFLF